MAFSIVCPSCGEKSSSLPDALDHADQHGTPLRWDAELEVECGDHTLASFSSLARFFDHVARHHPVGDGDFVRIDSAEIGSASDCPLCIAGKSHSRVEHAKSVVVNRASLWNRLLGRRGRRYGG